jgi:cytochrome P450
MRTSHSKLMRAHVQTLSWLFYNLSRNQDKEAELLKEVDSFNDGLPDYEELRHMKYITGAINETLRSAITTPAQIAPLAPLTDVVQLLSPQAVPAGAC